MCTDLNALAIPQGTSATLRFTKLIAGVAATVADDDDLIFEVIRYPGDAEAPLISLSRLTSGVTLLAQSGATLGQFDVQLIPAHTEAMDLGRYTYHVYGEDAGNRFQIIPPSSFMVTPL